MAEEYRSCQEKTGKAVITGIGVVSPLGIGIRSFWSNLENGISGIKSIKGFNAENFDAYLAAEVEDFEPENFMEKKHIKRYSRASLFAMAAARMALEDAGLPEKCPDFDLILGSAMFSLEEMERLFESSEFSVNCYKPGLVRSDAALRMSPATPASCVSYLLALEGQAAMVSAACASTHSAMRLALRLIQSRADIGGVLVGGTDTAVNRLVFQAFEAAGMLNQDHAGNQIVPFSKGRTKHVLGEGSCIFVLEDEAIAKARGARIYCQLASAVQSCENMNELFMLDTSGKSWADLIRKAISEAGVSQIDYINAHAPAHGKIDLAEVRALKRAFGRKLRQIPVSSIKGQVGQGFASAGAMQIASTAMSLYTKVIPPMRGLRLIEPEMRLRYIKRKTRSNISTALVNAHGLGGINACLVMTS